MAIEIVDFPMKNGGSFHSYVKLPEGTIVARGTQVPSRQSTPSSQRRKHSPGGYLLQLMRGVDLTSADGKPQHTSTEIAIFHWVSHFNHQVTCRRHNYHRQSQWSRTSWWKKSMWSKHQRTSKCWDKIWILTYLEVKFQKIWALHLQRQEPSPEEPSLQDNSCAKVNVAHKLANETSWMDFMKFLLAIITYVYIYNIHRMHIDIMTHDTSWLQKKELSKNGAHIHRYCLQVYSSGQQHMHGRTIHTLPDMFLRRYMHTDMFPHCWFVHQYMHVTGARWLHLTMSR